MTNIRYVHKWGLYFFFWRLPPTTLYFEVCMANLMQENISHLNLGETGVWRTFVLKTLSSDKRTSMGRVCMRLGRGTSLGVFQFPSNLKNNLLTLTPSQSSISCMLRCHCKLPMQIIRMGNNLNFIQFVSVNLWFYQWTDCWLVVGSMM